MVSKNNKSKYPPPPPGPECRVVKHQFNGFDIIVPIAFILVFVWGVYVGTQIG